MRIQSFGMRFFFLTPNFFFVISTVHKLSDPFLRLFYLISKRGSHLTIEWSAKIKAEANVDSNRSTAGHSEFRGIRNFVIGIKSCQPPHLRSRRAAGKLGRKCVDRRLREKFTPPGVRESLKFLTDILMRRIQTRSTSLTHVDLSERN